MAWCRLVYRLSPVLRTPGMVGLGWRLFLLRECLLSIACTASGGTTVIVLMEQSATVAGYLM